MLECRAPTALKPLHANYQLCVSCCRAFLAGCGVVWCAVLQVQSPLERADKLSEALGNNLLLKREDLQPVGGEGLWWQ